MSPIQRAIMNRLWNEPMDRVRLHIVLRTAKIAGELAGPFSSHGVTQSVNAMLRSGLLKEDEGVLYAQFDPEAGRPCRVYVGDLSHYQVIIDTWTTLARVRKANGDKAGWRQARENARRARVARGVARYKGPR